MGLREILILSFSAWAVFSCLITSSFEIFLSLLLIGSLVIYELSRYYIPRKVKVLLNQVVYVMLFTFALIVLKKAMEVLR
ncbi:MAG: hypothetical protein NZ895_00370 [Archaeoglobaceae archaeon]|nr:hypothetical protein [Archaeoglobaceae archaeon]MCX8151421.1 hypothetical protein [Archaeoglobaceae archaeon]MDW8014370.1 hypothetical protein [Archaeoglobaceae archaeon]